MSKNYVEPVVDINKFLAETTVNSDVEIQSMDDPWGDDWGDDWGDSD